MGGRKWATLFPTKRQEHKSIVKDVEATATQLLQPVLMLLVLRIPEIGDTCILGLKEVQSITIKKWNNSTRQQNKQTETHKPLNPQRKKRTKKDIRENNNMLPFFA